MHLLIEQLDLSCDGDYLYICDGYDESSELLAKHCSKPDDHHYISSGNQVFLQMVTGGSRTRSGFALAWYKGKAYSFFESTSIWCWADDEL